MGEIWPEFYRRLISQSCQMMSVECTMARMTLRILWSVRDTKMEEKIPARSKVLIFQQIYISNSKLIFKTMDCILSNKCKLKQVLWHLQLLLILRIFVFHIPLKQINKIKLKRYILFQTMLTFQLFREIREDLWCVVNNCLVLYPGGMDVLCLNLQEYTLRPATLLTG